MGKYDKIIGMQHHVSRNHPQMSMYQRAAQFAPFAALTGHEAAIIETARLTGRQVELSEQESAILDKKLGLLLENLASHPQVSICYFVPDARKDGGSYTNVTGEARKYDEFNRVLYLQGDIAIHLASILDIQGDLFNTCLMPD